MINRGRLAGSDPSWCKKIASKEKIMFCEENFLCRSIIYVSSVKQ